MKQVLDFAARRFTSTVVGVLAGSLLLWSNIGCSDTTTPDGEMLSAGGAGATCETDDECDDGTFCNGKEICASRESEGDTKRCTDSDSPCFDSEVCHEKSETCEVQCEDKPDVDNDGHLNSECGGDDCDDHDPDAYPGNVEVCDEIGRDEDCEPKTLGFDFDRDGHIDDRCCNLQDDGKKACGDDCDDLRDSVHPGAIDNCNDVDDDCNGEVDDDPQLVVYVDRDGDGFGLPGDPDEKTIPKADRPLRTCVLPEGYAFIGTDCNDAEPTAHPGAPELCDPNDVDEDCDGEYDEYGPAATTPAVNPIAYYLDEDDDGFGVSGSLILGCNPTGNYRALYPGDCRDDRVAVHPGVTQWQTVPACGTTFRYYEDRDIAPMLCGDHWECNDGECGSLQWDLENSPALQPVWDFDCSGAVEKIEKRTCNWSETSCEPIFDPYYFYEDSECGITAAYASYSCALNLDYDSCVDDYEPVGVGPLGVAPCR